jgi:hypothetical protein
MKINRIWSILSKGQPYGNPAFSRKVTPQAYDALRSEGRGMLDALQPYNDELFRAVHAEYVGQFLLRSQLRDRALALDPANSYEKALLQFPDPGAVISPISITDPFTVNTTVDDWELARQGTGLVTFNCTVDTVASTLAVYDNVFPYTVTNGLSSAIRVFPGLTLRFRSDFAALSYEFVYQYALPSVVDWPALRTRVANVTPIWESEDLKRIWLEDPRWDQRLAAFIMATVELFNRA